MKEFICWHDGQLKKLADVHVSVLDFGFIHAEATYDVMKIRANRPLFFDFHLERFRNSCRYFGFESIPNAAEIAMDLARRNGLTDAFVWLCTWRGTPPSGSPRDVSGPQHSLIYVKPYYPLSAADFFSLTIDRQHRRVPDACYGQEFKNFGWIELTLAQRRAVARGFDSALLLDTDDHLTEGPGFGVCFVLDGRVLTPARNCLQSVTISVIEKICREHGFPFARTDIDELDARAAQEAFACSTSGGITPIAKIDDVSYSHELTQKLKRIFDGTEA